MSSNPSLSKNQRQYSTSSDLSVILYTQHQTKQAAPLKIVMILGNTEQPNPTCIRGKTALNAKAWVGRRWFYDCPLILTLSRVVYTQTQPAGWLLSDNRMRLVARYARGIAIRTNLRLTPFTANEQRRQKRLFRITLILGRWVYRHNATLLTIWTTDWQPINPH